MTKADELINKALNNLGILEFSDSDKYKKLQLIMSEMDKFNSKNKIHEKTTGTINERYVEWALKATVKDSHYKFSSRSEEWLGDFCIMGTPMNITVSVKSYTAKERAHASGTGNYISPTILWGLFNDASEFGLDRLNVYLLKGFIAIYMPSATIKQLEKGARIRKNLFGHPLIRDIMDLPDNIIHSLTDKEIGDKTTKLMNPRLL